MKIPFALFLTTMLTAALAAPALADDKDALLAAEKAEKDAPTVRMTAISTDADSKAVTKIVVEMVKPELMRMKTEGGPVQVELVTDGKKAFMSQGGGAMTEAPPQVAQMITQVSQQSSLGAMTKMAQNVKLSGHDTVGGLAATVYTFDSDMAGVHSASKLWISDKDHRPLKAEGESHGSAPGMNQQAKITFDYDPAIKIVLPTS